MVGEARLTAHGSAGAALLLGRAAVPDGGLGAVLALPEVVVTVVACGVLATVESPEPQPVKVRAINTRAAGPVSGPARHGSDHTPRTVPSPGLQMRQASPRVAPGAPGLAFAAGPDGGEPPRPAALRSRSPLNSVGDGSS